MTLAALTPLVQLHDQLPLPLAQLVSRAVNANSTLERHQCVFYLGEVALKLATVVRVAPALAMSEPPAKILASARKLARASLGHWQELLREADRATPEAQRLTNVDVGPAADVLQAMVEADLVAADAARSARKQGVLGLFDAMVAYRNAVIGHGSARVSSFYAAWTERLARVLHVVLASPAMFAGMRLVVVETSEDGERRARALEGASAMPWDAHGLPEGDGLWLVRGKEIVTAAPLLLHRHDHDLLRDRVGFLQAVRAKRAEYLDYMTGEILEVAPLPESLPALIAPEAGSLSEPAQNRRGSLEPGGQLGGFDLLERLGKGGQGDVFRARQLGLDRLVALKVMRPDAVNDTAVRARFSREVQALVRSDHPNVVKVYAAGEADGLLYYAMELIDGVDLGHRADAASAIAAVGTPEHFWLRLASLFAGACDGVQHLHDHGIVHRDLKPENLLVSTDASRLVVTDLGLARLSDASAMTGSGDVIGTLRAMAPEQLERSPAASAPAVDIFGLGVALFELATQRRMRDAPTDAAVAAMIGKPAPRAEQVAPEVPRELSGVIARALELDPAKRWPSAGAFAAALRELSFSNKKPRTWPRVAAAGALLGSLAVGAVLVAHHHAGAAATPDARARQPSRPADAAPQIDALALGDGMKHIAGGTLLAGSTRDELDAFRSSELCRKAPVYCDDLAPVLEAQEPAHSVTVAPFELDEHELSRKEALEIIANKTHPTWKVREDGVFDEHDRLLVAVAAETGIVHGASGLEARDPALPVVGITWEGARALCAARGDRLPTDDEWELAARGVARREYPWGNDDPSCETTVFGMRNDIAGWHACEGSGPRRVDELHGRDRTPDGIRDLAGNVAEWVQSEHGRKTLGSGDDACAAANQRVIRGGQYDTLGDVLRGARRRFDCMDRPRLTVGVRCAR